MVLQIHCYKPSTPPRSPPNKATFHPSGTSVLLAGPRPFVCVYDFNLHVFPRTKYQDPPNQLHSKRAILLHLPIGTQSNAKVDKDRACDVNAFSPDGRTLAIVGRQGRVRLLDWASVSVVGEIKASATVKSVWWHADNGASVTGGEMYTLDANAEICAWDTRTRRCLRRWRDDSGYGTVIAAEGVGRYTAIGSKSGIVNVYDTPSARSPPDSSPVPSQNVTTPHYRCNVTPI
ncbi:WD40 repeat protein [Ceratobasidium sp. AG-Ba]|nr:WD40 repeat protein [Ceratobasidium sp. AG-Ba]